MPKYEGRGGGNGCVGVGDEKTTLKEVTARSVEFSREFPRPAWFRLVVGRDHVREDVVPEGCIGMEPREERGRSR